MPRQNNEAVVIGGGGFIGSRLCRLLAANGCNVTVVSRRASASGNDSSGYRFVRGEVGDAKAMMAAIEGASVVYHLAMGGGPTWADYQRDFIDGTAHVANACVAHGVSRLIFASSTSALYLGRSGTMDERDGTDPRPELRGLYSRGKILGERLLLDLHARSKFPVVIMRPAIVVGRGGLLGHGGVGYWPSDTCCLGWGTSTHPLPFVLVDDVAQALYLAKDAPGIEGKTFNLAGDVRPTASEYVQLVAERSHRNFRFYPQGYLKLQALEWLKWGMKTIGGKKDAGRQTLVDMKSRSMRTQIDCSAAKQLLGWKPVSDRDEFIREAIDCHLEPLLPGDLRHSGVGSGSRG